ncbi:hypothetical protein N0V83_001099 [Neocucurbitaria cava]|uniref:Uncharacterized protein n=1 Tax=Neocucurbitaria cava TaxID=798079 RepID=A0A9W8YFK2_9PLEO|nr:hypothetical protein N0V83_001099 [Neocucurbitaria cava]
MRANKQVHNEVVEYLYEKRTLFMIVARDRESPTLTNEYLSRYYETLASMPTQTRQHFTKLEIQIGYLSSQTFTAKRHTHVPSVSDPMSHILFLLPDLDTVVISFQSLMYTSVSTHRIVRERTQTAEWLIKYIPESVNVVWDLARAFAFRTKLDEQPMWRTIQARGEINLGHSVFTQLECVRNSYAEQKQLKSLGSFDPVNKQSHALNFWVANYGFGIDGLDDLDYDHSHLILPYWHRVPADSSLRLALLAVAHAAFGRARSSDAAIKKATNLYHRTLTRVKDEIEAVTVTNIEQLLLAVKLLESFEVRVERF